MNLRQQLSICALLLTCQYSDVSSFAHLDGRRDNDMDDQWEEVAIIATRELQPTVPHLPTAGNRWIAGNTNQNNGNNNEGTATNNNNTETTHSVHPLAASAHNIQHRAAPSTGLQYRPVQYPTTATTAAANPWMRNNPTSFLAHSQAANSYRTALQQPQQPQQYQTHQQLNVPSMLPTAPSWSIRSNQTAFQPAQANSLHSFNRQRSNANALPTVVATPSFIPPRPTWNSSTNIASTQNQSSPSWAGQSNHRAAAWNPRLVGGANSTSAVHQQSPHRGSHTGGSWAQTPTATNSTHIAPNQWIAGYRPSASTQAPPTLNNIGMPPVSQWMFPDTATLTYPSDLIVTGAINQQRPSNQPRPNNQPRPSSDRNANSHSNLFR